MEDFNKFKDLFDRGIDAYIINTGDYLGKKVTPAHSLAAIEAVVDNTGDFKPFGPIEGFEYLEMADLPVDLDQTDQLKEIQNRMQMRLDYILQHNADHPQHTLDEEVATALNKIIHILN